MAWLGPPLSSLKSACFSDCGEAHRGTAGWRHSLHRRQIGGHFEEGWFYLALHNALHTLTFRIVQECCVCNEKFEVYWDDDDDVWKLKDSLVENGKVGVLVRW
jgi:hypothetical protein